MKVEFSLKELATKMGTKYETILRVVKKQRLPLRATKSNVFIKVSDFDIIYTEEIYKELKSKLSFDKTLDVIKHICMSQEDMQNALTQRKNKKRIIAEKTKSTSEEFLDKIKENFYIRNTEKFIIHVGATSSGKTYNAVQAIKQSKGKCLYLSPLRLLAWEVYESLKDTDRGCNLITGEDRIDNGSDVVACTIEMANYNYNYDVVVIDESFMVSDPFRGKSWLKAIFNIRAKTTYLILNFEALEMMKELLTITNKNFEVIQYDRKVPIEIPKVKTDIEKLKDKTIVVVFSRKKAIALKVKLDDLGYRCSLLYGNLPPETKKEQINKFINGDNNICISTDVIGMGLNVPCDYVYFNEITKFDGYDNRFLNTIEVRQIGGRAGRYLLSDKGVIQSSNDEFVDYISDKYNENYLIQEAFYGIDDWMVDYLYGDDMSEKLKFYKKLDFIPEELSHIIKKQNIDTYLEILNYNNNINKLDYDLIWRLINLPVSLNSSLYFIKIVDDIVSGKMASAPNMDKVDINSNDDLKFCEDKCKEIDLYITAIRNKKLMYLFEDKIDNILLYRISLIDNINDFIINTEKMKIRRCPICDSRNDTKHKICDDCYKDMYIIGNKK